MEAGPERGCPGGLWDTAAGGGEAEVRAEAAAWRKKLRERERKINQLQGLRPTMHCTINSAKLNRHYFIGSGCCRSALLKHLQF